MRRRKTLLLHFDHIFQNRPPSAIGQGQRRLSLPIGVEELDGHATECLCVFQFFEKRPDILTILPVDRKMNEETPMSGCVEARPNLSGRTRTKPFLGFLQYAQML